MRTADRRSPPPSPPSRSVVEAAVIKTAVHLHEKIDAVEKRLTAKIDANAKMIDAVEKRLTAKIDANAKIAEDNHMELNRKLNKLIAHFGL